MCENSREDGLRRPIGSSLLVITERIYGDPLDGIHTIGNRQGVVIKKIEENDEPSQDDGNNIVRGYN